MDPYDLQEAFENGHRLVNRRIKAEMRKDGYIHIFAEISIYVNSMITTNKPDIVQVGPSNSCLCIALSSKNWEIEDLPEADE